MDFNFGLRRGVVGLERQPNDARTAQERRGTNTARSRLLVNKNRQNTGPHAAMEKPVRKAKPWTPQKVAPPRFLYGYPD
jgi:hypothetical protein